MTEYSDKLESLIKDYFELGKKMYIGDDLQVGVYDAREKRLVEIGKLVDAKVEKIIEFYKTLPKGEWCKSAVFCRLTAFVQKDKRHRKLRWISDDGYLGYEWCSGEDDGYPLLENFTINSKWLLEDDMEEVKRVIIKQANAACDETVLVLEVTLHSELSIQKQLETMALMH